MTFLPPERSNQPDALTAEKVAGWTVDQVMDHVEQKALPECISWMKTAGQVARKYNLKLVAYEAGQHLVGVGGGENNDQLTKLFGAANRSERMGKAYATYLKAWEDAGGDLLCNFSSVGAWSKWGSWGLVEYYDQDGRDSPKYRAVIDWANTRGQKMSAELPK